MEGVNEKVFRRGGKLCEILSEKHQLTHAPTAFEARGRMRAMGQGYFQTVGFEPSSFCMLSGCDTARPYPL
eukprot:3746200-Amphidinium_carterae.1